jgi:hypothetical protein
MDKLIFCHRLMNALRDGVQIEFRNLYKNSNSNHVEFDEFSIIKETYQSSLKGDFGNVQLKLFEIGHLKCQISAILQNKESPHSYFCPKCKTQMKTLEFCEHCLNHVKPTRLIQFDCITDKSEIIHVSFFPFSHKINQNVFKKMFPKEFKKFRGMETFDDLQKLIFGKHDIVVRLDSMESDIFHFSALDDFSSDLEEFHKIIECE